MHREGQRHFTVREDLRKINELGKKLYRIQATKDTKHAKLGDIGGWVEDENSIDGSNAWVADEAEVFSKSVISGNALAKGYATIMNKSKVSGMATISDYAMIDGATVFGTAKIKERGYMGNKSAAFGDITIAGYAYIEKANVYGKGVIAGFSKFNKPITLRVEDTILKNKDVYDIAFKGTKDNYYKLIYSDTKTEENGELLYRIQAIKGFTTKDGHDILRGQFGGYVESMKNLVNNGWIDKETSIKGNIALDGKYIDADIVIDSSRSLSTGHILTDMKKEEAIKQIEEKEAIKIDFVS